MKNLKIFSQNQNCFCCFTHHRTSIKEQNKESIKKLSSEEITRKYLEADMKISESVKQIQIERGKSVAHIKSNGKLLYPMLKNREGK